MNNWRLTCGGPNLDHDDKQAVDLMAIILIDRNEHIYSLGRSVVISNSVKIVAATGRSLLKTMMCRLGET